MGPPLPPKKRECPPLQPIEIEAKAGRQIKNLRLLKLMEAERGFVSGASFLCENDIQIVSPHTRIPAWEWYYGKVLVKNRYMLKIFLILISDFLKELKVLSRLIQKGILSPHSWKDGL